MDYIKNTERRGRCNSLMVHSGHRTQFWRSSIVRLLVDFMSFM